MTPQEQREATTMEREAAFLLMLDADPEQVLSVLMRLHPYETEEDMRAAIATGVERKESFQVHGPDHQPTGHIVRITIELDRFEEAPRD